MLFAYDMLEMVEVGLIGLIVESLHFDDDFN